MTITSPSYKPLTNTKVVSLALNLPGPLAAKRLLELGATIIKIEPPTGDPLKQYSPEWYEDLNSGQQILMVDLKSEQGQQELAEHLKEADLFLTAQRPAALQRLDLDWKILHEKYPTLNHLAITGYPIPDENTAGHDLTYQASLGLINSPFMPKTLIADMAGGEQAATQSLALLMGSKAGQKGTFHQLALSDSAEYMAQPAKYGLTGNKGILSGELPEYSIYETKTNWIAVAALEPHFRERLMINLEMKELSKELVAKKMKERTSSEWLVWAEEYDIPLVELKKL